MMLQPARDSGLQGTVGRPDAIKIVVLNRHAGGLNIGVKAQRVERRSKWLIPPKRGQAHPHSLQYGT